jgi:hypothetical protein
MEKTMPEMINTMTPGANPILVSLASTDYSVPAGVIVKGISAVAGTVIYVSIKDESGVTVTPVPIPVGMVGIQGITKVIKLNTDATGIVQWTDLPYIAP